ncbi:Pectinesterase inhibitor domain [Dillenia turbinata]|uniref:Pectinesterase inhibitor domain n=1 Tax=Dillenia turbinata TaxID=194707 RepID=A0AAN8UUI8_9MAGN
MFLSFGEIIVCFIHEFLRMAINLVSSTLLRRIPRWVFLNLSFSSISSATQIEIDSENYHDPKNSNKSVVKIQSSNDCVLDSTTDLSSALKIFKWVSLEKRFQQTADTYYKIILKWGMLGNLEEVEGFCREMVKERFSGTEETLIALINAFVNAHKIDEALRVLMVINSSGFKVSVVTYNVLLGAIVEGKMDFRVVVYVYKEMVKSGVIPNVDTLNYLLEALFDRNEVRSALEQYRRMRKKGCEPNSKTFEIVMGGLLARNQVDEAVVILHEMLKLECELDMGFYASMIPMFCRENKASQVITLYKRMKESKIVLDGFVFGVLIQCLCDNLLLDDACQILEEVEERGFLQDDDVLVYIVHGFCRLEKWNEALWFLGDKNVLKTRPHNVLLEGYCDAGKFLDAIDLLEKMLERNIADVTSWNILLRCFIENAWTRKAFELLGRMIVTSFVPDSGTYSALIIGKCNLNEYENALELFHGAWVKGWILESASYSKLLEGLCHVAKVQEAAEIYMYLSEKRCVLEPSALNTLILGLCMKREVEKAIRLRSLAYCSGTYCPTSTFSAIMLALYKSGNVKDLLALVSQMLVEGCPLNEEAYNLILLSVIAQGRPNDCAMVFNMMVSEGLPPDSEILDRVFLFLTNHSELHIIWAAIETLSSTYEVIDSAMYSKLIDGLLKEGYKNEARRLLDLMLERGWMPDAITHVLLIGSTDGEATTEKGDPYNSIDAQDVVSSILAEGFLTLLILKKNHPSTDEVMIASNMPDVEHETAMENGLVNATQCSSNTLALADDRIGNDFLGKRKLVVANDEMGQGSSTPLIRPRMPMAQINKAGPYVIYVKSGKYDETVTVAENRVAIVTGRNIVRVRKLMYGKASLGRPPMANSRTIIMKSLLGGFIHPGVWMLHGFTKPARFSFCPVREPRAWCRQWHEVQARGMLGDHRSTWHLAKLLPVEDVKKMNARIIYFAVCMAVVIGILVAIIGGTGLSQKMQGPNFKNAAKNPNAFTEICNQADYNETCMAALQSQLGQNTNATFQDIFMVSIKMTQESLNQNIDLASNMKNGSDPTSRGYMALEDCVQLLNSSIFDLQGVINLLNVSSNNSILNDDQRIELKNLASSAISFQQACIDGIEDVEHKKAMEGGMVNATRYCSNILAFADAHIGNASLSPRKLLTDDDGDFGYPSWLPVADRKLLASSEGNGEVKPDVVVAQDGSGQFDTISKALDSYDPNQHQGNRYVIHVKAGKYNETITVAENKVNVFIYGDGPARTIVTGHRSNAEGYTTIRTATFCFYYAEYGNKGRGADTSKRIKHEGCKVISDKTEALQFTAGPFIQGHLWLNSTGEPALLGLQY